MSSYYDGAGRYDGSSSVESCKTLQTEKFGKNSTDGRRTSVNVLTLSSTTCTYFYASSTINIIGAIFFHDALRTFLSTFLAEVSELNLGKGECFFETLRQKTNTRTIIQFSLSRCLNISSHIEAYFP